MPHRYPSRILRLLLIGACLGAAGAPSVPAVEDVSGSPEIASLVRQLGAASPQRRQQAERRLLEIGPRCVPALRDARDHRDPEVVARVRSLLGRFDRLLLAGAKVRLAVEPSRVRWDQPFDLLVAVENESPVACQVPFSPRLAELLGFSAEARQVGPILDVADFLELTGPDGEMIDLHVHDAADDPAVRRIVELRAEGLAYDKLAAGAARTYRVPALNRGWGRYRMLSAGTYRIRLVYQPEWGDPWLAERNVGRVESNVVEVAVLDDAPAVVRRAHEQLVLRIAREGDAVVGRLVNAYDLPVRVNLNINGDTALFARVSWTIGRGAETVDVPAPGGGPFDSDRLVRLEPGGEVVLARCALAELTGRPEVRSLLAGEPAELRLRYMSLISRSSAGFLGEDCAPQDRQLLARLPPFLVSGNFESEPVGLTVP